MQTQGIAFDSNGFENYYEKRSLTKHDFFKMKLQQNQRPYIDQTGDWLILVFCIPNPQDVIITNNLVFPPMFILNMDYESQI